MKWFSCLLAVLLLFSAVPTALAGSDAYAPDPSSMYVANPSPADRLHLRVSADQNAQSLGKYYNGTIVHVLETVDSDWVRVSIGLPGGTQQGFMMRRYLSSRPVKPQMPMYMSLLQVALMDAPSLTANSYLYSGNDIIYVMGLTENWLHVQIGNQTGFVKPSKNLYRMGFVRNPDPKDRLNIRKAPDMSAPTLGKYYSGCPVYLLGSEQNGWIHGQIGGTKGYLKTKFLDLVAAPYAPPAAMPLVTLSNPLSTETMLLGQPSSNANLGKYANGSQFHLMGICEDWVHVIPVGHQGIDGFLLANCIRESLRPF